MASELTVVLFSRLLRWIVAPGEVVGAVIASGQDKVDVIFTHRLGAQDVQLLNEVRAKVSCGMGAGLAGVEGGGTVESAAQGAQFLLKRLLMRQRPARPLPPRSAWALSSEPACAAGDYDSMWQPLTDPLDLAEELAQKEAAAAAAIESRRAAAALAAPVHQVAAADAGGDLQHGSVKAKVAKRGGFRVRLKK